MRVRGPNNFGRVEQTDPILLHYVSASVITEVVSNFAQQLSTTRTNMRQGVQTDSTSVTSPMLRPFALCTGL